MLGFGKKVVDNLGLFPGSDYNPTSELTNARIERELSGKVVGDMALKAISDAENNDDIVMSASKANAMRSVVRDRANRNMETVAKALEDPGDSEADPNTYDA